MQDEIADMIRDSNGLELDDDAMMAEIGRLEGEGEGAESAEAGAEGVAGVAGVGVERKGGVVGDNTVAAGGAAAAAPVPTQATTEDTAAAPAAAAAAVPAGATSPASRRGHDHDHGDAELLPEMPAAPTHDPNEGAAVAESSATAAPLPPPESARERVAVAAD